MSESHVAELLRRGIAAVKAGNKQEAESLLLQAVDLDERNEQAWLWLSGLVESMDDKRTCLENVLAINPANTHAQAGLRWLAQQQPEPAVEEPVEELEEEAGEEPEPANAQDLCLRCGSPLPASATQCPTCGQVLLVDCPACGQYVEIEQAVCPACGQELGDYRQGAAYYLGLANAYLTHRKTEQALEALGWVEAEAGDEARPLEEAAALYEKLGRTDSAIAAYERALALAPKNAAICTRLGGLYRQRGQRDEAQGMYEQALKLGGRNAPVLTELARLQIEQEGATRETVRTLGQAVKLDPKYAPAYLALSDAYVRLGDLRQATRQAQLACELTSPESALGLEARRKLSELRHAPAGQPESVDAGVAFPDTQKLQKRPGCLSLYAILLGFAGFLTVLGAAFLGILAAIQGNVLQEMLSRVGGAGLPLGVLSLWGGVGISVLAGVLNIALAAGLWALKNWARVLTIILQTLGFIGSLVQAFFLVGGTRALSSGFSEANFTLPILIAVLVGLVIQAYILFWFLANRERFH